MSQQSRLYLILLFLVVFVGVNMLSWSRTSSEVFADHNLDYSTITSVTEKDSCIIDFRRGLLGARKVILGETRFKEIKEMYGDVKQTNEREVLSLADGFFTLESELYYPDFGLRFQYLSVIHQRGQRNIFHNHKVNAIYLEKNCNCRTAEGIGFGSSYTEIINVLKPDEISYIPGTSSKFGTSSRLSCELYLSSKLRVTVNFFGDMVKDKSDFIVNQEIGFYIWPRR